MADGPDPLLLVGAGMASARALDTIRRTGRPVVLVGDEPHRPYYRPKLSKQVLTDDEQDVPLFMHSEEHYADPHVTYHRGARAVGLEPDARVVTLEDGRELPYDRLLIATGGRPRTLDVPGSDLPDVRYLRDLEDARLLRRSLAAAGRVVIIGAGLIGLEVASVARTLGLQVTVVDVCATPLPRLGDHVAAHLRAIHEAEGVRFVFDARVARLRGTTSVEAVELADGAVIEADCVVVGIGIVPNTDWLPSGLPGLGRDATLVVDDHGRLPVADIYAVGDVATWQHPLLGAVHSEQDTVAQTQGMRVGSTMAGMPKPVTVMPTAWSDQYSHELRAVGLTDVTQVDRTVDLEGPDAAVATLFLRDEEVVGAVAVGWTGLVSRTTRALQRGEPLPFSATSVRALTEEQPTA